VNVKVNQSSPKTNLPQNQPPNLNNPSSQINDLLQQLQQLLQKQIEQKLSQTSQLGLFQPQQNQGSNEFIVKSRMKASVVAIKVEQMLLLNKDKRITLSGIGYAVPILLDSVMLIRKDYAKLNKNLIIENIELFERVFNAKTVSGLKITLKLQ